nr:MAG TPA: hypothetical protein [Crassvirales sp.]
MLRELSIFILYISKLFQPFCLPIDIVVRLDNF